ncbi:MAG: HAMP domain-containing histidine kinase [Acidimicrobiia bacterium]|nr:HAMP domain-containing histidine kinase [Acidimicrobiia bacterium]NNC92149.1 HAMP domain-containing histidine kinase [Acidimicrobiia bacterium]
MRLLRRLDVRLLLSYVGVIAVTLFVMTAALQLLAPSQFETQVENIGRQYGFGRQALPESPDGNEQPPADPDGVTPPTDGGTQPQPGGTDGPGPGDGPGGSQGPGDGPGGSQGPGDGSGQSGPGNGAGGSGGGDAAPDPGGSGGQFNGADAVMTLPEALAQQGPGGTGETSTIIIDLENAFDDALNGGLLAALLTSLIVATALAALSSRRILKPLRNVQSATRRLAEGRYDERIPIPHELELAELAGDVNALGQTLQKTEQQRSRLMSDLAHELRTPLTTIQGYMEGLIDGVFEPTPEVFTEVAEEATRLKRLTADLALLSRAEEGALTLDLQTIDLGAVATRASERLRPQFLDQEVELSIGPMPDLPVSGDADRLAQVFTNIAGNALVHTPAGGRVWLTAVAVSDSCEVSVHDSGEGIPQSELTQIFKRFHRVGAAYGGSGIGLTISKTIVRSHDGEISVASDGPGKGATFTVRLPRVAT